MAQETFYDLTNQSMQESAQLVRSSLGQDVSQLDVLRRFSHHLFWDADRESIDLEENAPYVVQRVLEYGLLEDWRLLRQYYGLERIAQVSMQLRSLEEKALAFICTLTNTSKDDYRCYILKQSNRQPWNY